MPGHPPKKGTAKFGSRFFTKASCGGRQAEPPEPLWWTVGHPPAMASSMGPVPGPKMGTDLTESEVRCDDGLLGIPRF